MPRESSAKTDIQPANMARPYPSNFNKDSPLSAQSSSSGISYQANINRQKTKKWVEAKPVNYGGDDWGDDDEYDPPQEPVRPRGLPQQSQTVQNTTRTESTVVGSSWRYGNLPRLSGASDTRTRANSFEEDEEEKFSSTTLRQTSAPLVANNRPATRFSQITGISSVRNFTGPPTLSITTQQPARSEGFQIGSQIVSPISASTYHEALLAERVDSIEASSIVSPVSDAKSASTIDDHQSRKDYSPSVVPPPLANRASPNLLSLVELSDEKAPLLMGSLKQVSRTEETMPRPCTANASSSTTLQAVGPPIIQPPSLFRQIGNEEKQERGQRSIESIGLPSARSSGAVSSDGLNSTLSRTLPSSLGAFQSGVKQEKTRDLSRPSAQTLEYVSEPQGENGESSDSHTKAVERVFVAKTDIEAQNLVPKLTSKLLDLSSIFTLGLDIFSPKPDDVPLLSTPPHDSEKSPIINSTIGLASILTEERVESKNQLLGFNSVVHQAFTSAEPRTPAPRCESEIKRTDSESTGTGGISPIMRLVPSITNPDSRDQDFTTILEAENESRPRDFPESAVEEDILHPNQHVLDYEPGHRHDTSIPSARDGPARIADIAIVPAVTTGQPAIFSVKSPDLTSSFQEDEPSHLKARKETIFRPTLPGAWTSYTDTERSASPSTNQDSSEKNHRLLEDDYDKAPTVVKGLPSITGGVKSIIARKPSKLDKARTLLENGHHRSAGLSMAPGRNVPSTSSTEPRFEASLQTSPSTTQLQSGVIYGPPEAASSMPPPPTKDTPISRSSDNVPESTLSLEIETSHDAASHKPHSNSPRAGIRTNFQADSDDDQHEILRVEIMKSPGLRASDTAVQVELQVPEILDETIGQGQESMYLLSEYENYWASTAEDQEQIFASIYDSNKDKYKTTGDHATIDSESNTQRNSEHIPPTSLNPHRVEDPPPEPSHLRLRKSFSWGKNAENICAESQDGLLDTAECDMPKISHEDSETLSQRSGESNTKPQILQALKESSASSILPVELAKSNEAQGASHDDNSVRHADLAALSGAASNAYATREQYDSERPKSLIQEWEPRFSAYLASPSPPESEHPSPELHHIDDGSFPFFPSTVSPIDSPTAAQVSVAKPGSIPTFQEIMRIESSQERIQTFNEARHRFAVIETGLSEWVVQLKEQFPEHAGVCSLYSSSGSSVPGGSARAKSAKATAGQNSSMQAPYYQKYLNASSPTSPTTPTNKPGQSSGPSISTSQQGLSPSNKITSQQVQAKGKEFLHNAGVFGGKAGKAGKELLAKGKNKLRAAGGGGEKPTQENPQTKARFEKPSSWGLPLSLARPPGKLDGSRLNTREMAPLLNNVSDVPRLTTMTSTLSTPSGRGSRPQSLGNSSLASLPINVSAKHEFAQASLLPHLVPEKYSPREYPEKRAVFSTPTSVLHRRLSLDLINSSSVAEKAASQYAESPKHNNQSVDSSRKFSLSAVVADSASKIEGSNSEVVFRYALEGQRSQENSDEWVMVSKNPDNGIPLKTLVDLPKSEIGCKYVQESPLKPATHSSVLEKSREEPVEGLCMIHDAHITTITMNRPRTNTFGVQVSPLISPVTPPHPTIFTESFAPSTEENHAPPNHPPPWYSSPGSIRPCSSSDIPSSFRELQPLNFEPDSTNSKSDFLPPIRRNSILKTGFELIQEKEKFLTKYGDYVSRQNLTSKDYENRDSIVGTTHDSFSDVTAHDISKQGSQGIPVQDRRFSNQSSHSNPQSHPLVPHLIPKRLPLAQANSREHNQHELSQHHGVFPLRLSNVLQRPEYTQSQVEWRPNRPSVSASQMPPESYWKELDIPAPRSSYENEDPRRISAPDQLPENYGLPCSASSVGSRLREEPPSLAQRYAERFKPEQPFIDLIDKETGELSSHISTEFRIPGDKPPADLPPPHLQSRRNSDGGLYKEIGEGALVSQGNEFAKTSVNLKEGQNRKSRRPSFFGNLNRGSTAPSAWSSNVHSATSGTDGLSPSERSPPNQNETKRSFFGGGSHSLAEPRSKTDKLSRSSTDVTEQNGKKKRFSNLVEKFKSGSAAKEVTTQKLQPLEKLQEPLTGTIKPDHHLKGSVERRGMGLLPPAYSSLQSGAPATYFEANSDRCAAKNISFFSADIGTLPSLGKQRNDLRGSISVDPTFIGLPATVDQGIRSSQPDGFVGESQQDRRQSGNNAVPSRALLDRNKLPQSDEHVAGRSPNIHRADGAELSKLTRRSSDSQTLAAEYVQPDRGISRDKSISTQRPSGLLRPDVNSICSHDMESPPSTVSGRHLKNSSAAQYSRSIELESCGPKSGLDSSVHRNDRDSSTRHQYMATPANHKSGGSSLPSTETRMMTPPGLHETENLRLQPDSQRPRNVLSMLTTTSSRPRKNSASALLSGLMSRLSDKTDRLGGDTRIKASRSQVSQSGVAPSQVPRALTGSDSQAQSSSVSQPKRQRLNFPARECLKPQSDGEHHASRGLPCDSVDVASGHVPVPVLGQIAEPGRTDNYPRVHSQEHIETGFKQPIVQNQSGKHQQCQKGSNPVHYQYRLNPTLGASPNTYEWRSATRRLSREDMLARSPPKSPDGQQRPHILSLPGSEDLPASHTQGYTKHPTAKIDTVPGFLSTAKSQSGFPSGYNQPEDLLSAVNQTSRNYLIPPAAATSSIQTQIHSQIAVLDRSNTTNTASTTISGISNLSGSTDVHDHQTQSYSHTQIQRQPQSKSQVETLDVPATHLHDSSKNSLPPSPVTGTPDRNVSPLMPSGPSTPGHTPLIIEKTNDLPSTRGLASRDVDDVDLYNASPRLPHRDTCPTEAEEKIVVDHEYPNLLDLAELDDHEPGAAMSATSYPGQEWNPYNLGTGVLIDD